jgi:hypothetical protein
MKNYKDKTIYFYDNIKLLLFLYFVFVIIENLITKTFIKTNKVLFLYKLT